LADHHGYHSEARYFPSASGHIRLSFFKWMNRYMLVNKKQLAELVGRSERTLTTWSKQGMPVAVASDRGRAHQFDTTAVIKWMIQHEIDKRVLSDDNIYDLTAERARLAHHQANISALDEATKNRELLPFDVVVERWQMILMNVRQKCLAMPSSLAAVCANSSKAEVQTQAEKLIRAMLTDLAADTDY